MSGPFAESATHHGAPEVGGKAKGRRELVLGGVAAVLLVAFLLLRSRNQAPAAAADTTTAADGNTLPTAATGGTGGYGNDLPMTDALSGIQASETANTGVLNAILDKLNAPVAPPKAGPPATPATPGHFVGTPAKANPPPAAPKPAVAPSNVYVVKPGDNLTAIGRAHGGISWQTLYALNKTTIGGNPNLIHPGQRLTL